MSRDEPSAAAFRFAALWLIAFNLQTAIIDSTAKFLAEDLHSVQVTWGYFVAMLLGLTIYSAVRGVRPADAFRTGRPWLQLLRPLLITLTLGMLFTGLAYLPLAEAIAITFMSPLFVTALSVPLLGERVGIHRWLAVLAGVVGMLILVRPAGGVVHWAALLTLGSALAFALFQIVTRRLMATETTTSVLFWTAVGSVLWASLAVPFFWTPLALWQVAVLLGIGLIGVSAHFCMIRAFTLAEASQLAPFNYIKLVWAVLIGYAVWGDVPDPRTWLGSAIIIASGLYVYWREQRRG